MMDHLPGPPPHPLFLEVPLWPDSGVAVQGTHSSVTGASNQRSGCEAKTLCCLAQGPGQEDSRKTVGRALSRGWCGQDAE